jgi:hypothetical protein
MPATRSQRRRRKPIVHAVNFGDGEVINFTFDANKITDEWMERWMEAERQSDAPQLNAMLADVIEEWDLLEDEGGPVIAVTATEIGKLFTLRDKYRLLREFIGLPSDAEGNASESTSSSPSSDFVSAPASPQNGPPTSPTPEPVASPSSPQPT